MKNQANTITALSLFLLFCFHPVWADDQSSFRKHLDLISQAVQWSPLHAPSSSVDASAIATYQSLSYLQGYNPRPAFKNVVYYNKKLADSGYNLFVSAQAPQAQLLDMNGRLLHQWHFPCSSIPGINKDLCPAYWVKARILGQGDLIAMVPYTGLIKLDKHSKLIWFIPGIFHHDFAIAGNGDIYALSMKKGIVNTAPMIINYISVYSPSGGPIKNISLYRLFKQYPDGSYLKRIKDKTTAMKGAFAPYDPGDVFHANSIQVITPQQARNSKIFKPGQLLVSVRQMGLVMAVDPKAEKITWLMDAGIWHKGQHFAHLLNNGNILIFDNFYTKSLSRVVEFDPSAKKIIWDYKDQKNNFFSSLLGECYRLPNGNTLITESLNGHSFEVTPDKKIVWDFYNPYRAGQNNALIAVTYQMKRIDFDKKIFS